MMKTKKLDFLLIIAILITAAVLVSIVKVLPFFHRRGNLIARGQGEFFQAFPTPGSDLRAIESNLEVRFPPSACEIYALVGGSDEPEARARFTLPAKDLPMFIRGTFCDQPFLLLDPHDLPRDEDEPDWWQPDEAQALMECVGVTPYSKQVILVDRSDQDSLVIYVLTLMGKFDPPVQ